jgi:hypothetical protein
MRNRLITCLLPILAAVPVTAQASLEFDLGNVFNSGGGPLPHNTPPWLRAVFEDNGSGGLTLTLSSPPSPNGLYEGEKVAKWYFNLDPSLDPTRLTIARISGVTPDSIETGVNSFKADGDGQYDILFTFPTGQNTFGPDGCAAFTITSTESISEGSFNFSSYSDYPAAYKTAAHIIGNPVSDWANIGGSHAPPPIPEPAGLVIWSILGGGAAALTALRRRRAGADPQPPWSDDNRAAIHDLIARGRH